MLRVAPQSVVEVGQGVADTFPRIVPICEVFISLFSPPLSVTMNATAGPSRPSAGKSKLKPATYVKTATDFQNNRKVKATKHAKRVPENTAPSEPALGSTQKQTIEKKSVFRTTLDNPFHIEW